MKIKFKPQQQDIIDQSGSNLLVSASAGSGKTTVMIAKIVDMILKGKTQVDKILVLTYTNSAASEMKQKLIKVLKENIEVNEFLEEEIEKVETSDISTIHSFCQKLIKRNFHAVEGLDMSFDLLSDYQRTLLKSKAMKTTLFEYKQKFNQDYMQLMQYYGKDRTDSKIIDIVYSINNYLEAMLDKDEFRNNTALKLYDNKASAYEILNKHLIAKINSFIFKFKRFDDFAKENNLTKCLINTNDVLNAILQISSKKTYLQNIRLLMSFSFKIKQKEKGFEDFCDEIATEKSALTKWIKEQEKKQLFDEEVNNLSFLQTSQVLKQFLQLEKLFEANYEKLKKQKNALDFSDLERYAIKLTSMPELQNEIKAKYEYIFIDEFQDANPVQERLLENISRQDNLFMVGDVKQSIYGFRRSTPEIFLNKQKDFQLNKNGKNKFLNLNFRSDKTILEFVNTVFDKIMTPITADISYKDSSRFIPFKQLEKPQYQRVKITAINPKDKISKQTPNKVFSMFDNFDEEREDEVSSAEAEAFLVAEDILKLKKSYLFEGSKKREVNFKDMTIMVRKRGKFFDVFCDKLVNLGVPIYANSARSIFEEPDSKKILALLKLTQNFNDDYSLAIVMNSYFCAFSFDELAEIKLKVPDEKFFHLSVLKYKENFNDELADKIKKMIDFVEKFSLNVQTIGIYLALINAFKVTDYKEKVLCLPQGQQRLVSLEKFLQVFLNDELNFNLSSFLEFERIAKKEIKAPNFFTGDEDCVNVTTIHSSKGLEYPIVFFVEAGSDLHKSATHSEIQINDNLGAGLMFYHPENLETQNSVVFEAIKAESKKSEFAEKLRLLYVGLTRSIEYLYVYGKTDIKKLKAFENEYEVLGAKSYIELILRSVKQEDLEEFKTKKQIVVQEGNSEFVLEQVSEDEITFEKTPYEKVVFSKGDQEFENQIKQTLDKQYEFANVLNLPIKNSVSSLIKNNEYASINTAPQKLTMLEHLKNQDYWSELGTLYHKVFEIIDFNNALTIEELKRLIDEKLNSPLKDQIDVNIIFENLKLIRQTLNGQSYEKEKKFMMYVPYNQVNKSDIEEKILVQGIIDLYSIGEKNILIDYKLTSAKSDEIILSRYTKQILLYKKALSLAHGIKDIECYILDINRKSLIKVDFNKQIS